MAGTTSPRYAHAVPLPPHIAGVSANSVRIDPEHAAQAQIRDMMEKARERQRSDFGALMVQQPSRVPGGRRATSQVAASLGVEMSLPQLTNSGSGSPRAGAEISWSAAAPPQHLVAPGSSSRALVAVGSSEVDADAAPSALEVLDESHWVSTGKQRSASEVTAMGNSIIDDSSFGGPSTTSAPGTGARSSIVVAETKEILSQRVTGFSKDQHIKYLEAYIARQCSSGRSIDSRAAGYCRVIDSICDMHPTMVNIYSTIKHFVKEIVQSLHSERKEHARRLIQLKKEIHMEQQQFYEDKFVKTIAEMSQWQAKCKVLTEEVAALRKARDEDLNDAKKEVMEAVVKAKEDDEDMKHMRVLVTTVFKVAREHELRSLQLQECLIANHIAIPPPPRTGDEPAATRSKRNDAGTKLRPLDASAIDDGVTSGESSVREGGQGSRVLSPLVSPAHATHPQPERQQQQSSAAASKKDTQDTLAHEDHDAMRQFMQPKLKDQVSIDFIQASKRELEQCRLSTQRVLVSCAADAQSSYKLLVSSLQAENAALKQEVSQLQQSKAALEHMVHEKRFARLELINLKRDEAALEAITHTNDPVEKRRALWNRDGSTAGKPPHPSLPPVALSQVAHSAPPADVPRDELTPRPLYPFEVQPTLGVDLRQSSARIASELSSVAMNLKKMNEELHVRVRRLASCVTWMDEYTVNKITANDDDAFLRVAPSSEWDHCHHFLRSPIQPHVVNLQWTAQLTSFVVFRFFDQFEAARVTARFERDMKMLSPRVFQPYERKFQSLVRLDASIEDVQQSIEHVPVGYVVTQFLINELTNFQQRGSVAPDMLQSKNTNTTLKQRSLTVVIEAELAKLSHNLWYAARKHRYSEPLCQLFVSFVEGRLPRCTFDAMQRVIAVLTKRINAQDGVRSSGATFNQLAGAIGSILSDQEPEISRGAVFALSQTLEAKGIPQVGKISAADILVDESKTIPKKLVISSTDKSGGAASGADAIPILLSNAAQSSLPTAPTTSLQIAGASLLIRYFRRLVLQKLDAVYRHTEALCYPHVRESKAVKGMYLLRVSACAAALKLDDENPFAGVIGGDASPPPPTNAGNSASDEPLPAVRGGALSQHLATAATSRSAVTPSTPMATSVTPLQSSSMNNNNSLVGQPLDTPNAAGAIVPPPPAFRADSPSDAHRFSSDVPPYLHVGAVPVSVGTLITPQQRLVRPCSYHRNFMHIVTEGVGIQRYSSSIHFPPDAPPGGDSSSPSGAKKSSGRRRSFKKQASSIVPLALDDQDWVEWFAFLYALRNTPLKLDDVFLGGWNHSQTSAPAAALSPPPQRSSLPDAAPPRLPLGTLS